MRSALFSGKRLTSKILKIVSTIMLILGLVKATHTLYAYWLFEQYSFPDRLVHLWSKDIEVQRERVPAFWSDLKETKFIAGTKTAKIWKEKIAHRLPLQTHPHGKYSLEIFLLPWKDGDEMGASVQYFVIELNSGNTVWESGRTYRLGNIKKTKKPVRLP